MRPEASRPSAGEPFWAGSFAKRANEAVTTPWAPVVALLLIGIALAFVPPLGIPPERLAEAHLFISITTLLLVFLLEHNEDRDKTALHIKLDEILAARGEPGRQKVGVEELPATELRDLREEERERVRDRRD